MLHIISRGSLEANLFERVGSTDAILFIEDAVLMLLKTASLSETLQNLAKKQRLSVLIEDITIRGIAFEDLVANIKPVDYSGFVQLTLEHEVNYSWA